MQSLRGLWQPRKQRPQHPAAAAVWDNHDIQVLWPAAPVLSGGLAVWPLIPCTRTNSSMWVGGAVSPAASLVGSAPCCRRAATLPSFDLAAGAATPSAAVDWPAVVWP
jgi:hypothetical protein